MSRVGVRMVAKCSPCPALPLLGQNVKLGYRGGNSRDQRSGSWEEQQSLQALSAVLSSSEPHRLCICKQGCNSFLCCSRNGPVSAHHTKGNPTLQATQAKDPRSSPVSLPLSLCFLRTHKEPTVVKLISLRGMALVTCLAPFVSYKFPQSRGLVQIPPAGTPASANMAWSRFSARESQRDMDVAHA